MECRRLQQCSVFLSYRRTILQNRFLGSVAKQKKTAGSATLHLKFPAKTQATNGLKK